MICLPEGTTITASSALSTGKQTAHVYVPRIVHVDWASVHALIGVATHTAWAILARKYKSIRLVGKSAELHRLAGDLMKAWCWELVEGQITT